MARRQKARVSNVAAHVGRLLKHRRHRCRVISAPAYGADGAINLERDIAAAKAALLYADSVEILNPVASLIYALGLAQAPTGRS